MNPSQWRCWWTMVAVALQILGGASRAYAGFAGTEAAGAADRGAILTRLESAYPKTLNPMLASLLVESDVVGDYTVFETLVAADPDSGEISCWLCSEFTYEGGNKKVAVFKLRPDLRFHDGSPLTALDVKFSFDVMVHPKVDNLNLKSDVMAAVEKVEAIDDHTLRITFKKVKYANIYQIASVPVIPKHLFPYFELSPEQFNRDQKFGRVPMGSGPYKFSRWEGDKFIELERNDDWWGFKTKDPRFKNAFNFRKIRYKFVTNDNVALQAFRKGEFDYMELASYQYDELRKNQNSSKIEAQRVEPEISQSFMVIAWNARLPKFKDPETREALELLTDRASTLAKFSKGLRPQTNGPWGSKSPYQCPLSTCPVAAFDPARAKALLAKAGWRDSDGDGCLHRQVGGAKQDLQFTIMSEESDWSKNVLSVYVTEMKKAGVCAQIRTLDWTAMQKLVDDLNFEAVLTGWGAGYPILPRQLWHSENTGKTGSNYAGFSDPEADRLIEAFEAEFDEAKRITISQQLHERIYRAHPVVWHHEGGGCLIGHAATLKGVAGTKLSCSYWPRWYKVKK